MAASFLVSLHSDTSSELVLAEAQRRGRKHADGISRTRGFKKLFNATWLRLLPLPTIDRAVRDRGAGGGWPALSFTKMGGNFLPAFREPTVSSRHDDSTGHLAQANT